MLLLLLLIPINANCVELAKESESALLMENSTGKILYEFKSDEKMIPASTTKIMVLILLMEDLKDGKLTLEDKVMISNNAAGMGGSQVYLEANSQISVLELLKSIAIASANDASVALAEHLGGSTEAFVSRMNDRCKALGCTNTNFINVHGLEEENHYTTAKDLAIMARELLKHSEILKYTSIYEDYLNKPDGTSTWMVNTNKLVRYYQGLDGLKTGHTQNSGFCLVSTAERNNMRLIGVVLKSKTSTTRSNDTIELLNYGFGNYKVKTILDTKKNLGDIEVVNGKKSVVRIVLVSDATNLESINESKTYSYNIKVSPIKAPVKVGDKVGYLEIIENNEVIKTINITVAENIKKANFWDLYKRNFKNILLGV